MSLVTVVTPTTGRGALLGRAVESVQAQARRGGDLEHWLVVDGESRREAFERCAIGAEVAGGAVPVRTLVVPEPTGANQFNGHRIYAAASFLVASPYIAFLDEDNWFEPDHLESLLALVEEHELDWAHSLRNIVEPDGRFVCRDDCESLGAFPTVVSPDDHLVDVSCFLLRTRVALAMAPLWYRQARAPGVLPADRAITRELLRRKGRFGCTGLYTLNYRTGSRADSVKSRSFVHANQKMRRLRQDQPWRERQVFTSPPPIRRVPAPTKEG
jgi:glycosyltransferase involved in cell wall biosynthesis